MSKKKQKKTSLKSSILLLLLMALLLITSSYAWFTANQQVTVSQLQVNVKASNGLQISADAQNWKTVLEKADLENAAATYPVLVNQLPSKDLEPVSTSGNATAGKLDMFYGTVTADENQGGEYFLSATKQSETTGATGKYIAFDLFLKVDVPTTIYMTPNSKVSMVGTDKGLQNAARVGFVNEGNIENGLPADLRNLSNGTSADIWEPNYDTHTPGGIDAARDYYSLDVPAAGGPVVPYFGIKANIDPNIIPMKQLTTTNPDANYFAPVTPKYTTAADNAITKEFMNLPTGVTKIRVYMWIEGQDVDCENGASGSDVTFDLQFTVAP